MPTCLIGLGSNLGNRRETLDTAIERLSEIDGIRVTAISRWLETSPVGGPPDQQTFLNGAAVLETSLPPESLLETLHQLETALGRRRRQRWGPRSLDLDLLLYDRVVRETPTLSIPHPRMAWRRFVLEPAAEIAASMIHPGIGWSVGELLRHLDTAPPYLAVAGPIGVGKTHLAKRLTETLGADWIAERVSPERLQAFYADPSSHAWRTESAFLEERAECLAVDSSAWTGRQQLAVSDFWFDQSLAFARVWLDADKLARFQHRWQTLRADVVRPKLIVLLDAPTEVLEQRIVRRGRPSETALTHDRLDQIRRSILEQIKTSAKGPLLRLAATSSPEEIFDEVVAAFEAMR